MTRPGIEPRSPRPLANSVDYETHPACGGGGGGGGGKYLVFAFFIYFLKNLKRGFKKGSQTNNN